MTALSSEEEDLWEGDVSSFTGGSAPCKILPGRRIQEWWLLLLMCLLMDGTQNNESPGVPISPLWWGVKGKEQDPALVLARVGCIPF